MFNTDVVTGAAGGGPLALIAGLLTARGGTALGVHVLRLAKAPPPEPFVGPAQTVVGLAAFALVVELTAMLQIASRSVLIVMWAILAAAGLVHTLRGWRPV